MVMAAVAGPFVETDHEKTIKLITAVKNAVHEEHKHTRDAIERSTDLLMEQSRVAKLGEHVRYIKR